MDAKHIKFLQLFGEFSKIDIVDTQNLQAKLLPIIKLEFELGTMIWEYLTKTQYDTYSKSAELSLFVGNTLFDLFYQMSPTKTINAITDPDVPSITQFVFEFNPNADKGQILQLIQDSITSNKHELSHIYLSNIQKNRRINYGNLLKTIVEHCISHHIKRLQVHLKICHFPKNNLHYC